MKDEKGITLVALVITIIILLILAGVSISTLTGDNGLITQALEAGEKTKLASYKESVILESVDFGENSKSGIYYGEKIKEYIPNIKEEHINEFLVLKNVLIYIGNNEDMIRYCKELDIDVNSNGLDSIIISEYIANIDVNSELTDIDKTPEEYIGIRLYDRTVENSLNWKVLVEYNEENVQTDMKGSDWYIIETGTIINGYEVSTPYLINYKTSEVKLVQNYKVWDINSTLAVSDGLVLNIDSKNMESGEWGNIEVFGNVAYQSDTESLYFDGDGDYLKVNAPGDFSEGFTFEIYTNLERILYDGASAMFSRMTSLTQNDITQSMRFGYISSGGVCKFNGSSSWIGNGENMNTEATGQVRISDMNNHYQINEDFYLTFVYRTYNSTTEEERGEMNWTQNADRVEYYIDGELYGYTYYGSDSYQTGCTIWNKENTPVFIGATPWWIYSKQVYYLKGDIYTCRLYENPITQEEVTENYNTTIQWRNTEL